MSKGSSGSIGRTTKVTGRLTGDGDLLVEGSVDGELTLKGHLHVAAGGSVTAPVEAEAVTIEGTIDGDVHARGAVSLRAGGHSNRELQSAWTAHGADAFSFEPLEQLKDEELAYVRDTQLKERFLHWRSTLNGLVL